MYFNLFLKQGTPDIVEKVNNEFYVTFHGYDYKGKRAVRGVAAASENFTKWRTGGERLFNAPLFTYKDCNKWNV